MNAQFLLARVRKNLFTRPETASAVYSRPCTRLGLECLEDRVNPAELYWVGGEGFVDQGYTWTDVKNWKTVVNNDFVAAQAIPSTSDILIFEHTVDGKPVNKSKASFNNGVTEVAEIRIKSDFSATVDLGTGLRLQGTAGTPDGGYMKSGVLLGNLSIGRYGVQGQNNKDVIFEWEGGEMRGAEGIKTVVNPGSTLRIGPSVAPQVGSSVTLHARALEIKDDNAAQGGRRVGNLHWRSGDFNLTATPLTPGVTQLKPRVQIDGTYTITAANKTMSYLEADYGLFIGPRGLVNVSVGMGQNGDLNAVTIQTAYKNNSTDVGVAKSGFVVETGRLVFLHGGDSTGQFWTQDSQGSVTFSAPANAQHSYGFREGTQLRAYLFTPPLAAAEEVKAANWSRFLNYTLNGNTATINVTGSVKFSSGSFQLYSGTMNGGITASVVSSRRFLLAGGTVSGGMTIQALGGSSFSITGAGDAPQLLGSGILNHGTLEIGKVSAGFWPQGVPNTTTAVDLKVDRSASIITVGPKATVTFTDNSNILAKDAIEKANMQNDGFAVLDGATIGKQRVGVGNAIDVSKIEMKFWQKNLKTDIKDKTKIETGPNSEGKITGVLGQAAPGGVVVTGEYKVGGAGLNFQAGSLVSGDGTLASAVGVLQSGTFAPGGFGAVGLLTVDGDYTVQNGAVSAFDLGASYDQIVVTDVGTQVTLSGVLKLTVLSTLTADVNDILTLIDNGTDAPVLGTFDGLAEGDLISIGGWVFQISYEGVNPNDQDDNDVILKVVSKPSASTNTGSVTGTVFVDQNGDGSFGVSELGAGGVAVDLINLTTGHTLRTVTGSGGTYLFSNLAAGSYQLRFDQTASSTYAGHRLTTTSSSFSLSTGQALTASAAGLILNAAPVGADDAYATTRGDALSVLAGGVLVNDADAESDTITAVLATGPQNGTLSLNANGSFTYTPNTGFVGTDGFSYRPVDAFGPGELTYVTISVLTHTPTATADTATATEDGSVTISVLANDTDPDSDTLAVAFAGNGLHGTTVVNANGTITYTPDANWNGTDAFSYWVSDGAGGLVEGVATVTVTAVNDAPTVSNPSLIVQQNTPMDIDLWVRVSDVETAPTNLAFTVSNAVNGTIQLLSDGHTARFTPNTGYAGPASFSLSVTDTGDGSSAAASTGGTASAAVNTPPYANNISVSHHLAPGQTANIFTAWGDVDFDTVTLDSYTQPDNGGTVAPSSGMMGTWFTFTAPSPAMVGATAFTFTITDGRGGYKTATVTVTLTNQAPTGSNMNVSTSANTPFTLMPMIMDMDGDTISVTSVVQPSQGTVAPNQFGQLVYTPPSGFTGQVTFNFTVSDGHGGTLTIYVTMTVS